MSKDLNSPAETALDYEAGCSSGCADRRWPVRAGRRRAARQRLPAARPAAV